MYRRVVFIGLGGSGGKTLRFIKRDLRHWLTEHDWPESREIPDGFQFLHIDTPTAQDGMSMGGAPMLPDNEYLGLVGPGVNFQNVVNQLDNKLGIKEEFAAWRVAPPLNVPIATGAGAYRAVGRTIALAYMDQIKSGVRGILNRASSPKSVSDLTELWKKFTVTTQVGRWRIQSWWLYLRSLAALELVCSWTFLTSFDQWSHGVTARLEFSIRPKYLHLSEAV